MNNYWRIEIPCKIYSADAGGNRQGSWEVGDKVRVTVSASSANEAVQKLQESVRYAIREIEFT